MLLPHHISHIPSLSFMKIFHLIIFHENLSSHYLLWKFSIHKLPFHHEVVWSVHNLSQQVFVGKFGRNFFRWLERNNLQFVWSTWTGPTRFFAAIMAPELQLNGWTCVVDKDHSRSKEAIASVNLLKLRLTGRFPKNT